MTLPTQRSPFASSADMDINSIMNNREFQEMIQEYFESNTMTMDNFLENLPRFMMQNYGLRRNETEEDCVEDDDDDDDYDMDDAEESFIAHLQQSGNYHAEPLNTSDVLIRSLLAGRREIREIPLRTILPQSPPPSPTPNLATTTAAAAAAASASSIPFFQRNHHNPSPNPRIPARPPVIRRAPSQLRNSSSHSSESPFDPNGTDKSSESPRLNFDHNNNNNNNEDMEEALPLTSEFLRRYGNSRLVQINLKKNYEILDRPER